MRLGAYYAVLEPGTKVARGLRRAGGQRAPSPPLRVQLQLPGPPRRARLRLLAAPRPTGAWSSSSSWPTTRSGSARRPIRSSRADPTGRTRCSASSSAPRSSCGPSAGRSVAAGARDGAAGARPASATSRTGQVHPGHVWRRRRRPTSRRPTASRSSATSCARRAPSASSRWCSTPRATRRWCSSRSTGRRSTRCVVEIPAGMRDVEGEPTSRRRPGASWSRRSASPPARPASRWSEHLPVARG